MDGVSGYTVGMRITVQMEIAFTVWSVLIGLYAALFGGAPVFIWLPSVIFVGFTITWIMLYRQAEA